MTGEWFKPEVELECTIANKKIMVIRREDRCGISKDVYWVRVYDIYVDNNLVHEGMGEPFTPLSNIWKGGP